MSHSISPNDKMGTSGKYYAQAVCEMRDQKERVFSGKTGSRELLNRRLPRAVREQTMVARLPGLTSWWDCPVPLTGVYSRDIYADGHEDGWLVVTTNEDWSVPRVRTPVRLHGHRGATSPGEMFWHLTRFHSTAWNLVISQLVFVCLTYSLLQLHLLRHGHHSSTAAPCLQLAVCSPTVTE